MMKKLVVILVLMVGTGYLLDLCFWAMNQKSDLAYVGGIFGLCVWCWVVVVVLQFTFKRRNHDSQGHEKSSASTAASDAGDAGRVHVEDRAGNGGHRSGPVG
jgi:hypothetical protein